ncbi:hypothetical protein B0H11DRAFT_573296 [Mycena galericulata]|nr:hypothetical protein B0H11DRAFT_573296 [Mycena galericulata]
MATMSALSSDIGVFASYPAASHPIISLTASKFRSLSCGAAVYTVLPFSNHISRSGGTFWNTNTDDPTLNGLGMGYFLTISALLAGATSDPMYLQAATEAADFFHDHLLNVRNELQDTISARANDSCSDISNLEPYNSGLMIEGLSILYSITGNATVQELCVNPIQLQSYLNSS